MPWQMISFGDIDLPLYNPTQDHTNGEVESTLVDSVGGSFDYYDTRQHLPRTTRHQLDGIYMGELYYIVDDVGDFWVDELGFLIIANEAEADLRDQVMQLRAMRGKVDTLMRMWLDDHDKRQIKTARLLSVPQQQVMLQRDIYAELGCLFETRDALWLDEVAIDHTTNVASTTKTLIVEVSGDAAIEEAVLTVSWVSGSIASVRVYDLDAGIDITITGALVATGDSIVVDDGAQTVTVNGADAYRSLTRGSGHTAVGWLTLAVGVHIVQITVSGGTGAVSFAFRNRWQ